ncbi:MAG: FAD-dependent oxidoreductase [Proteobacteria bacterium]|nr:FAD-dependent oxidoreductase [Pseudomonadota bacterium]MBU1452439.1 FAD-dependent oxidoreductase [Pseudomonadota bacterium]MBU2467706.1 FAD-dependent oxidoreductase [Pseudomonadota bacterium]MBU2518258.1 FAD-dependent oxidoreductase [Pseudomonadota bacterium]
MKLVIVGGVAGGATAAARARRLNEAAQITLIEKGPHVSFANCGLPYYVGKVIKRQDDLLISNPLAFKARYDIEVLTRHEVTAIGRASKELLVRNLLNGQEKQLAYDKLILATGAEPMGQNIPGAGRPGVFALRSIPDADSIKRHLASAQVKNAVVVGAGAIGLEMADNLLDLGTGVTLLEMGDQVLPALDPEMAAFMQAHLRERGVDIRLEAPLQSIEPTPNGLAVHFGENGGQVECGLVLLCLGVRPQNLLAAQAGLALSPSGHVRVDARMATSDPDIFAVGDVALARHRVTGHGAAIPLAGPANKQGRIAADNALGRCSLYQGSLATNIVQCQGLAAAATGLSQKAAAARGLPHLASFVHGNSHSSYYPGAEPLCIKLIFTPGQGRLLGAQVVGAGGVDKRIDVLATAIHGGLRVFDLQELDLAYAPQFGSAKDPINLAGYAAGNLLQGDVENAAIQDLFSGGPEQTIIDLRLPEEIERQGAIAGSLVLPLPQLRQNLDQLDKSKSYLLCCSVGLRGYLAYRLMRQAGFQVRNLNGGYRLAGVNRN